MERSSESIFLLPLPGARLLYAPLHRLSSLLNDAAIAQLKGMMSRNTSHEIEEIRHTISSAPDTMPRQRSGPFLPEFLGLIPTRGCNLDCGYCGFRSQGDASGVMTPELIVSCIEWYAKLMKRAGRDVLNIHFFGGEPFVQPALCMMAVHAARVLAERYGMRAVFEAATNGVMSEQTAQFVSDAIDHIVLSLDGPPEIQNKHRPLHNGGTSFESVYRSARIFSEGPANLCLRACITSETVGRMEEIALWFCGEFKPSSVSFETLQESPESKKAGFQAPDPWDFAMNFVKAEVILDRFGVETVYATAGTQAQTFSFCPVAKDVPIVSPDGQIAGCYLLEGDWQAREMDLHLGKVSASGKVRLQKKSIERLRALNVTRKPRCEQCFCKWHCAGGCHVNHSFPGCARNYDSLCLQTRVIALFRILKSLKREDLFERLVEDRPSLEKIVLQNSDVFSYQRMEEAHA